LGEGEADNTAWVGRYLTLLVNVDVRAETDGEDDRVVRRQTRLDVVGLDDGRLNVVHATVGQVEDDLDGVRSAGGREDELRLGETVLRVRLLVGRRLQPEHRVVEARDGIVLIQLKLYVAVVAEQDRGDVRLVHTNRILLVERGEEVGDPLQE
jgi:hypothetical protein